MALTGSALPPGRVRHAFSHESGKATPSVVTSHGEDWMMVTAVEDGRRRRFVMDDPDRLQKVLGRKDLTRLDGKPLALASPKFGLIAIAVGPPTPPEKIEFLLLVNIADMWMPGAPHPDAKGPKVQPDWWILGIAASKPIRRLRNGN